MCIFSLFSPIFISKVHHTTAYTIPINSCVYFLFFIRICLLSRPIIIIIIIIYSFRVFHISVSWWFFTGVWVTASLLKSPQVSRTRLRIQAVLSNAVNWIVFTRPPTSKSSRPFNNPFVIVPKAPTTIGTIVTFMFHSFFNPLARWRYYYYYFFRLFHTSVGW